LFTWPCHGGPLRQRCTSSSRPIHTPWHDIAPALPARRHLRVGTLTGAFALLADYASLRLCGPGSGAAIFGCSDGASGGCRTVRAGRLVVHQRRNRSGFAGILWAGRQFAAAIAASGWKIGQATIDLASQFMRTCLCRRDPGRELSLPFCFLIFGKQATARDADRRASRDHIASAETRQKIYDVSSLVSRIPLANFRMRRCNFSLPAALPGAAKAHNTGFRLCPDDSVLRRHWLLVWNDRGKRHRMCSFAVAGQSLLAGRSIRHWPACFGRRNCSDGFAGFAIAAGQMICRYAQAPIPIPPIVPDHYSASGAK
jgi:hypothetical protein